MKKEIKLIRRWMLFFMMALFFSGLTAIPLESELSMITRYLGDSDPDGWFNRVLTALKDINDRYPFLAYGYDWLAFAHFVLAILFIGPFRDPVKNKWVVEFGIIACGHIIPFAFVAGAARGIPIAWQLIDCSFGVFGVMPLLIVHRKIGRIERALVQSKPVAGTDGGFSVPPQLIRKLLRHSNPCNN